MEFIEAEDETPQFVDAERIWLTLDGVRNAPNLYESAAEKFPDPAGEDAFDEPAFDFLEDEGFVEVPTGLRNNIDRFRHLEGESDRTRNELQAIYRQLRTTNVQLRKADRDLEGGVSFLKSKSVLWEQKARRDALAKEVDALTLKRRRLESDLEKAGTLLRTLMDTIYRDQRLRESFWYQERPVVLTHHGRFLIDYLADMNPANFRGRSLAEIIEIGASLA